MRNNDRKMNKAALFFGAGVCFFLGTFFHKDSLYMVLGVVWIAVGLLWVRKNRRAFGEED